MVKNSNKLYFYEKKNKRFLKSIEQKLSKINQAIIIFVKNLRDWETCKKKTINNAKREEN